ncbi:dipeptidase, partial [Streptomyces scabiei]|uniref:dipeptidase n=1 Tax=Streptomyces scabiei TaxID=1930 RepID=UPI00211B1D30
MADLQDELQAAGEAGELDTPPTTSTKPKPKRGHRPPVAEPIAPGDGSRPDGDGADDDRPDGTRPEDGRAAGGRTDAAPRAAEGGRAAATSPVAAADDASVAGTAEPSSELAEAHAFLVAHPVADGYSGLPWVLRQLPRYDLELGEGGVDTDVPRMRKGHIGALFWSLHLPEGLTGERAVGATLEQLDLVRTVVHAHPEGLRLVHTAGETTDARNCGRVAVLLGPAGAPAIGDSLGILRALNALGLKTLTLAGASWAGESGLSRFGEDADAVHLADHLLA